MVTRPEVGTNNYISNPHRNKAQRSFQPVKTQRKIRNLIFLISKALRNSGPQLGGAERRLRPPKQKSRPCQTAQHAHANSPFSCCSFKMMPFFIRDQQRNRRKVDQPTNFCPQRKKFCPPRTAF